MGQLSTEGMCWDFFDVIIDVIELWEQIIYYKLQLMFFFLLLNVVFCPLVPQALGQRATLLPPRAWGVFQGAPPSAISQCCCPELSFHASHSVDGTVYDDIVHGLFLYTKTHKEKGPKCALMSRRAQYPMFGMKSKLRHPFCACCKVIPTAMQGPQHQGDAMGGQHLEHRVGEEHLQTSWLEVPGRLKRWAEPLVKQMIWLHDPAHETDSGSRLANPRGLDVE